MLRKNPQKPSSALHRDRRARDLEKLVHGLPRSCRDGVGMCLQGSGKLR